MDFIELKLLIRLQRCFSGFSANSPFNREGRPGWMPMLAGGLSERFATFKRSAVTDILSACRSADSSLSFTSLYV
jgi:hypothetical protein